MTISAICKNHVVTITEDATIDEVAYLMKEENVGCVVVINNKKKEPIGIITDRDIVTQVVAKRKNAHEIPAEKIMNKDLLILKQDKSINDAIKGMQDKGVRRAPVIDSNNQLCGIVTADDLLILLAVELSGLSNVLLKQTPNKNEKSKISEATTT